MSDLIAQRQRLGNGHRMWLKNVSPPWQMVVEVGQAWDEVVKDQGSPKLIEAISHWTEPVMQSNKQCCEEMKIYFEQHNLDPLNLDVVGPYMWLRNYIIGMKVGMTFLMGQPPPKRSEMEMLKQAGAMSANCFYSNFNAWLCGSQTFAISLPLAAKLLLTDTSHVQWKDFHSPFPSFIIQLPPDLATLVDPRTGDHKLDTVVIVDGVCGGRRRIEMLFAGQENENSSCMGDDACVYANMWCNNEDDLVEEAIHYTQRDDAPGELARVANLRGDEAQKQLMRWAVSIILYLTDFPEDRVAHINPEINRLEAKLPSLTGKPRQNAKAKVRSLLKEPVPYLVGTKVTIDPTLEKIASAIGKGQALPPSVASYVRGHRKMQPHGPQRSLRKPIWVDPYWRNLESEASTSKTYEVK